MNGTFCPICRAESFFAYRFGLLRCGGCGLVVNPAIFRPGAAEALNEEAFGESHEPETSFWVPWFESWKNRRYLRTVLRHAQPPARLLEIGVGSGSFRAAARGAGFDVWGCDLSASVARRVEERYGIRVHCGPVASLPPAHFDVVAMHHVLEHVEDPVGFLRAVRDLLKPGGMAHIAVPNVARWEARFPGWNYDLPYHLTYFECETLARGTRDAGLVPMWHGTYESFSTWFLTLVRAVLGLRPTSRPRIAASIGKVPPWWPVVEHPYRLAMLAAGVATWPLRRIQGAVGHGDELLLVARKTP